jgi:DNA polymerase elongation subunit (family B)
LSFYYLLDARNDGRIIALRFYDAQTGEIREIKDADYKPYFYLPHPMSKADEEGARNLHGETQIIQKRDLFTDELKELTKVTIYTLDALHKAPKLFDKIWESEIEFTQSYVYDHNLTFGAAYINSGNQLVTVNSITSELEKEFENTFTDTKTADTQKYSQIKHWFNLIQQPIPQLKPEQLGVEEIDPERLLHAFTLARIANVPVVMAYQSHRVSDWLKSIIHAHLRKSNILIPTSNELRRGLETHRVPGALTVQPKAGVYFNTVVCDFESLYPSVIDSYNLSYETVNCPHEECRANRVSECKDHWVCTKRRGIWSMLVGAIKDLRIRWFKPLSKDLALSEQERRNAQTLAKLLKLLSVSSYGVTVRIHGLACPPLAECITGYGRWALQTTWDTAKANGMQPTYGDTDSIFLDNPQPSQVEWLLKTVKEKLKLDLAIEKQYSLCVLPAAKKAYFGILPDGTPDLKGLTAMKSNSTKFIQRVFQDCVKELANVRNLEEYEEAKKRIVAVVKQADEDLKQGNVPLEDLVYSVQLFFEPNERLASNVMSQPYQCAVQLQGMGVSVKRNDTMRFIKVKPFAYKGKSFTVKPVEQVKGVREINVEDYIRNMTTALSQTFASMGIELEKSEKRISDWL